MNLLDKDKVDKFFTILEKLGRICCRRYKEKSYEPCEREVFTRRVSRLFKSKTGYIYDKNYTGRHKVFFLFASIRYALNYGCNIEITFFNPATSAYDFKYKMDVFDCKNLIGEWISFEKFTEIVKLFAVDLPLKTYRFECMDWTKWVESDSKAKNKKNIKSFIEVKTYFDEDARVLALEEVGNKNIMVAEKFTIL